jgi:hypothetical protein
MIQCDSKGLGMGAGSAMGPYPKVVLVGSGTETLLGTVDRIDTLY